MVKFTTKCRSYDLIVYSGSAHDVINHIKPRSKNMDYIDYFLGRLVHKRTKKDFTDRDYEIIQYLISKGADTTAYIRKGNSRYKLLDLVLKSKDEKLIKIFVQDMRYVDDDDTDTNLCNLHQQFFSFHTSSVLAAVAYQNLDLVQYAVKFSSHHNERSFLLNNTPLHIAASLPRVDITKYILKYYPNLEEGNILGETPLFFAVKKNRIRQVRFLLEIGANFRTRDLKDNTLLHVVCYQKRKTDVKMLEILLDAGCDPNAFGELRQTPLHFIAKKQHKRHALEFAKLLIQRGGDVNIQDFLGDTVLHDLANFCEGYSFIQFFDLFLDSGANLTIINDLNRTYLDILLLEQRAVIRQMILKTLILRDVSGQFKTGFNPISYLSEDEQFEEDCRDELRRLNSCKIPTFLTEPEYSLVRILISNKMQISNLCINPKLRKIISEFNERDYKYYGCELKTLMESGLKIFHEREDAYNFFYVVSEGKLYFQVINEIINKIPIKEWYKFGKLLPDLEEPVIKTPVPKKKKSIETRLRIELKNKMFRRYITVRRRIVI
ncbi:ankyrin-1-like [Harmonia axyridis]|uniref:ankyrin-1-like n=1 Tax=Harmonia axyridis TaxID=115357 RepID=UPI001E276E86|nr:ankyrin-1-like [Harmonia axyridis]